MIINDILIDTEVEKRDRNWMIRIYSELERNGDVGIECHREVVLVKDGKKWDTAGTHGERRYTINKLLSQILYDTVTLPPEAGGITLTAGQIALALEMLSDRYADVVINTIAPDTCVAGSTYGTDASFELTVTGSLFHDDAVVLWNGVNLETTFVDSTHLTAIVPEEFVADVGNAVVAVLQHNVTSNSLEFAITES